MWLVSVGKVRIFSVGTLLFGLLLCSKGKLKGFSNEGLAWSDLSKLFALLFAQVQRANHDCVFALRVWIYNLLPSNALTLLPPLQFIGPQHH